MSNDKYNYEYILDEDYVKQGTDSHCQLLRMVKPGAKVLECGPAYGIMTKYLKECLHCTVYIIEYDKDSFEHAIKYADGGICADIEDDSWFSEFDDESFDYIIYADILEHLRNPQQVLTKMKCFLKNDGSVLLSVPNVANGNIIMNLLCDRFHYTSLGLLDNTHIYFFAREDLHTIIQKAGYYLAYESCTLTPLFGNEQSDFLSEEERMRFVWVLAEHITRNVYQFICRLVKVKEETKYDIGVIDEITISPEKRLFLELGNELAKVLNSANVKEQMLLAKNELIEKRAEELNKAYLAEAKARESAEKRAEELNEAYLSEAKVREKAEKRAEELNEAYLAEAKVRETAEKRVEELNEAYLTEAKARETAEERAEDFYKAYKEEALRREQMGRRY